MKVTHYKPGDRVKLLKDLSGFAIKKGDVGTVSEPVIPKSMIPEGSVMVRFERNDPTHFGKFRVVNTVNVRECDLVPASIRHIVFDITDDGGEAKYMDGEKIVRTAEIERHPEDEPSDFNAMMFLIGKLFPESKMVVRKSGQDECEKEEPPVYDDFIPALGYDDEIMYVNVGHITSICESDDGDVSVYATDGAQYTIRGKTVDDVMEMIREARGW